MKITLNPRQTGRHMSFSSSLRGRYRVYRRGEAIGRMGGGTMRAFGRAMGVGSIRGSSVIPLVEQVEAIRRTSHASSTSVASVGDSEKGKVAVCAQGKPDVSVARKSSWEIDDWEFAEDPFELEIPPPRIVFGPPPTRQEAVEVTAVLRETLHKIYFSSPATASNASDELISSEAETKVCVASDHAVIAPVMQNNVLHAFSLLNESSDVQNMVASLASDYNIWEAAMKNEKVLEFCQSNNASLSLHDASEAESVNENFGDISSSEDSGGFWSFLNDMKLKMSEFITKVSEIALSFTGLGPKESSKIAHNEFAETAVRASLMLAVVVMFVVVLKRVP